MLSRLAVRTGQLRPVLAVDLKNGLCLTAVRSSSTSQVENWKKANDLFYSPERDLKNFPVEQIQEDRPPVKLGLIPEAWFKSFYEKTGVTGPYLLGLGLTTSLISKELWVVEHSMMEFIGFWTAVYFLVTKFGPKAKQSIINQADALMESRWYAPMRQTKEDGAKSIEMYENAIAREDGQKYIFEAKRENVALQLEEEYRRRLFESYEAVKRRLDYHLAVENTKRRFEQQHMVNWIVDSVVKGITPQQEKESINKCISDLKVLSKAN